MSHVQPVDEKEELASSNLTQRQLARLLLDVGTSPLVVKGTLPGRLTPEQEIGLQKAINSPLTSEDFDAMDKESSVRSKLTKDHVYIILVLLFEGHMAQSEVAALFNVNANCISVVCHAKVWPGTFQRYARDRGLDAYALANPVRGTAR